MRAALTFTLHGRLQRITLPSIYTVGREESCDLVLPHGFVSSRHCTFFLEPHGVAVVDHESSNGTVVNGAVIRGKAVLSPGDVIEVGPFVLTLSMNDEDDSATVSESVPTAPRPALTLGLQMQTMTERPAQANVVIEVVDGPRTRNAQPKLSFRDAVKTKSATTLIVGDLLPCENAGAVLGQLRQTLRDLTTAGAMPAAIAIGIASALHRQSLKAQLLVARVDAAQRQVVLVNAHPGEPYVIRGDGSAERLEGERSSTPLGAADEPRTCEEEITLANGEVLVLPSANVVGLLRMMWALEPPFLAKERRAAAVSMWLTNQLAKSGESGSAVCAEVAAR